MRRIDSRLALMVVSLASLFISLPAQACQLVCIRTTAAFQGNFASTYPNMQAAADDKCHQEYPGFKAARSHDVLYNIPAGSDSVNGISSLSQNTWRLKATNNCTNFTALAGNGTVVKPCVDYQASGDWDGDPMTPDTLAAFNTCGPLGTTGFGTINVTCNTPQQILCCNM
jgi:hypothetical protein